MKRFRDLKEGLSHKVPVYHEPDKLGEYELVGHVHSGATSIGAAKLAKKKSATLKRIDGTYGWVASDNLKESALDVPTHSPETLAKKHGVSVSHIHAQLKKGIEVEHEHTSDSKVAREIALDHLGEKPDYYSKLDKAKLEEGRTPKDKTLQGHPYHHKSDAELHYIIKDAGEAEKAIGSHDKKAMWKYGDQQSDAASVLAYRRRGGKRIPEPIKEELTPREKLSGAERLAVPKPVPMDHAQQQKKELAHHDNTNDSVRKNLSQGGVDSSAHKTIHHATAAKSMRVHEESNEPHQGFVMPSGLKEGSDLPFHKYTNDELDAAIKHHADSATELRRFDRKSHAAYQHIQHAHAAREILKSRKRNLRNYGMDEAYDMAFHESDDHLAQFSHHWAQFKKYDNLAYPNRGAIEHRHLSDRNHHEQEMNKHYKNLTTQQKNRLRLAESTEGYQVGDKVVAKIGPHKGQVHRVIHVHPTGHLNIKPEVHVSRNKYHLGAAKADPKDVERAPVSEESSKRTFYANKQEKDPAKFTKMRKAAKKSWGPWGSWGTKDMDFHYPQKGINSKTVQEAFQAAKDKKNGKQDNLPQSGEGANEPGTEKPDAPSPQPQAQGGDAPKTQDGGAPGAQQKQSNTPKPEASNHSKKLVPKGKEQFQPDPYVTPLTTMPDTASPKSGSQGVR